MADEWTIANALRLADGCVKDARTLAASGSRNAAYLSEQALEQIIRAIATSERVHIERHDAHQLDKFIRRLPEDHSEIVVLRSLAWLEAYATTFRYTLPSGRVPKSPDPTKLAAAIEDLRALVVRAAEHFSVDLATDLSPARDLTRMRANRGPR